MPHTASQTTCAFLQTLRIAQRVSLALCQASHRTYARSGGTTLAQAPSWIKIAFRRLRVAQVPRVRPHRRSHTLQAESRIFVCCPSPSVGLPTDLSALPGQMVRPRPSLPHINFLTTVSGAARNAHLSPARPISHTQPVVQRCPLCHQHAVQRDARATRGVRGRALAAHARSTRSASRG